MTTHYHQPLNSYSILLSYFCMLQVSTSSHTVHLIVNLTGYASQMRYHCLDITFPASCNFVMQIDVFVLKRRETVQFYSLCSKEIARSPPLPLKVEILGLI